MQPTPGFAITLFLLSRLLLAAPQDGERDQEPPAEAPAPEQDAPASAVPS